MLIALKTFLYRILRRSEHYTRTDMVYLARGGFWNILGTILSTVISFGLSIAFANLISKEAYGTYQYVLVIAELFGIFMLGGIDTAFTRSVARGMDGSIWDGLRAKVMWGFLGSAGSVIVGGYYLAQANYILGWAFVIVGVSLPFWKASSFFTKYLQGKKRFDLNNLYGVGTQAFSTIAIVTTLVLTNNILILLAVYLCSTSLSQIFFFWRTLKKEPLNTVRDPDMVRYGKHLTVMTGVNTITSNLDDILLWHFLGPASVAIYTFAQAIPMRAASLVKAIDGIAFPKLAATELTVLTKTLPRKVWMFVALALVAVFIYIGLAPLIFTLLFPQYMAAVPYTQVFAFLIALRPFNLFSSTLSAQAKTRALYIYNIAVPVVRITLLCVLIPLYGIWGAVSAYILTEVFNAGISIFLFYRS